MNQIDSLHSLDPFWIFRVLYELFTGGVNGSASSAAKISVGISGFIHNIPYHLINFFARYVVFSILLSIVLLILSIIYIRRFTAIRKKIMDKIIPTEGEKESHADEKEMVNPKWQLIEKHINSDNQADWKLAILEADIMLAELLESMALPGDSIGEKLKAVEKSDFGSLEEAWEGHKIRNAIAHEGSDFLITEREAKRVISLYHKVFDEFDII
ncbi:MAG: hypothetical protein WC229_01580 [Candidatus Paceibacterota bacterium]|jgi:hypothetical protein